jgi:hypothetical protein
MLLIALSKVLETPRNLADARLIYNQFKSIYLDVVRDFQT